MLVFSKEQEKFLFQLSDSSRWEIDPATIPRPLFDILKYLEKQDTLVWEKNNLVITDVPQLKIRFGNIVGVKIFIGVEYKGNLLTFYVDGLGDALTEFCSHKETNTKHTKQLKQELIDMFDSLSFKTVNEGGVK